MDLGWNTVQCFLFAWISHRILGSVSYYSWILHRILCCISYLHGSRTEYWAVFLNCMDLAQNTALCILLFMDLAQNTVLYFLFAWISHRILGSVSYLHGSCTEYWALFLICIDLAQNTEQFFLFAWISHRILGSVS